MDKIDNPLQYTIDKVNQDKLDIIEPSLANSRIPSRVPSSYSRRDAINILQKHAPDAARTILQAQLGSKVSDVQLRAAALILEHVIGKPKVQIDISHEVKPYNWVIRELTESTYSQENEEGNGIVLIENTKENDAL